MVNCTNIYVTEVYSGFGDDICQTILYVGNDLALAKTNALNHTFYSSYNQVALVTTWINGELTDTIEINL